MPDRLQFDRALGVFETLLVLDGEPVELDAHLARMRASVCELYGEEPPEVTRRLVLEAASTLPVGRLRLTVLPACAGGLEAGVRGSAVDPASVFPSWERAPVARTFCVQGGLGAHKWGDRELLTRMESGLGAAGLALLVDRGGEVLEASRANVFALEQGALITPARDGRILPGTARARVISLARASGLEVREEALTLERLRAAGVAFLTGSVRGIEPLAAVDGCELRPPGEAVAQLTTQLRRAWSASALSAAR